MKYIEESKTHSTKIEVPVEDAGDYDNGNGPCDKYTDSMEDDNGSDPWDDNTDAGGDA